MSGAETDDPGYQDVCLGLMKKKLHTYNCKLAIDKKGQIKNHSDILKNTCKSLAAGSSLAENLQRFVYRAGRFRLYRLGLSYLI